MIPLDTLADYLATEAGLNNVKQSLVQDLEAALAQTSDFELNENMHAALYPLSDQDPQDVDGVPWEIDSSDFVTFLSKINVVRNESISKCSVASWPEVVKTKNIIATGNSRDAPTAYQHLCPNHEYGCKYNAQNPQDIQTHFRFCKVTSVEAGTKKYSQKAFPCVADGCSKSFETEKAGKSHHTACHSYTPKGCDKGCDPAVIFPTSHAWKMHVAAEHAGFPKDFKCLFPGCTSKTTFKPTTLTQHLVKFHRLNTPEERLPYVPIWRPRSCQVAGCKKTLLYHKPARLVIHMLKDHNRVIDIMSDPIVAWD